MPPFFWAGAGSRRITHRIIAETELVLASPAHFGAGEGADDTDMPLLVDPADGKTPLLPGASLAGALRAALREREHGYRTAPPPERLRYRPPNEDLPADLSASARLFGGVQADPYGEQSPLIVDDARPAPDAAPARIELRDGVRLDASSRTAAHDALFNVELWETGTRFRLHLELVIRHGDDAAALRAALHAALAALDDGTITLGARKRRGYGRIHTTGWRWREFDLTTAEGLVAWLEQGTDRLPEDATAPAVAAGAWPPDRRRHFDLRARLALDGALLIRSGGGAGYIGPDMVHLRTRGPDGELHPIVSGTSLGGALRARAYKIAATLGSPTGARALVDAVFGRQMDKGVDPEAGRLTVAEHVVDAAMDLVQNRVGIDPFTGGTREAILFNEQPAFGRRDRDGRPGSLVEIDLRLVAPEPCEIGLLLLLLKDLWTGDLPLGGTSSIGRGRLAGMEATLRDSDGGVATTWEIQASDGPALTITGAGTQQLEDYVTALGKCLREEHHEQRYKRPQPSA